MQERSLRYIGGWSEETAPLHSKDGKTSLYILPQSEGDDKYLHLVLKNRTDVKRLTKGKRAVYGVYAWDEKRNLMYVSTRMREFNLHMRIFSMCLDGMVLQLLLRKFGKQTVRPACLRLQPEN